MARCVPAFILLGLLVGCSALEVQRASTEAPAAGSFDAERARALDVAPSVESAPSVEPSLAPAAPRERPAWLVGGGPRSVESETGVVVSVEAHATRAGVGVLERGGNAVDAAVAVALTLAVTHPVAGNLGGGGFMLVKFPDEATVAVDFRERAPTATSDELFREMLRHGAIGARAVAVPGTVAGLLLAHDRWGALPRATLVEPAIALARDGHRLGERQALTLRWAWPELGKDAEARRIFGDAAGRPRRAGQAVVQRELADTLSRIARDGREGFYEGETAEALVRTLSARGGTLSSQDLSEYRAVFRSPLATTYRGLSVQTMGPPSAGGVAVVEMLSMLETLEAWQSRAGSVDAVHVFAEVAKRAHADRRFAVGDPDELSEREASARAERWRRGADWLERFPVELSRATPVKQLHPLYGAAKQELLNTTHFSVVDAAGAVVSCTTTLSRGYGARFVVPQTGLLLNNALAAFGTAGENVPAPKRRMTSSMAPTLVLLDEEPLLVLGSPGGDTIPNTVVQVLRNVVDEGMPLDLAVDTPRVHHGFVPDQILYESTRPPSSELRAGLQSRGHKISGARATIGDANNVVLWRGTAWAYADPREGGLAAAPSGHGSP